MNTALSKLLSKYHVDAGYLPHDVTNLQIQVSNLLTEEKWDDVSQLTSQIRSKSLSSINQLQGEFVTYSKLLHNGCTDMDESIFEKLSEKLKDPTYRNALIAELEKEGKSASLLDNIEKLASKEYNEQLTILRTAPFEVISEHLKYVVALGYTGFWGGFHSSFNQYILKFKPQRLSQEEISSIENLVNNEQTEITNDFLKIYSSITKGNANSILHTCLDVLRLQEQRLKFLATLCAAICASTQAALKGKFEKDAKMLSKIDLVLGQTSRQWILLCTAALYYAHVSISSDTNKEYTKMIKSARKLPFQSKLPNGKNVSLRDLATNGNEFDDMYVEVTGFVRGLHTKRTSDGKLLTIFTLYEPGKDETIDVAVIYEHMGHRGLINSSYVRLHGHWKQTSVLSDSPILQLDRLALSELSKESWFENMITDVRPWFDYYPNSHHAFWSIRPERKGKSGSRSTITGAGELVFIAPFSIGVKKNE